MSDLKNIMKAMEFASHLHSTQHRKGTRNIPYINHPIQVATLLANEGGETDPVLITAAILHDVIEDAVDSAEERSVLVAEISNIFGEEILALTLEVTDDNTIEKKKRKQLQIDHAKNMSVRAKKLRIADKIINLQDIIIDPPEWWPIERIVEYIDWSEKVVSELVGVNSELESLYYDTLEEAREKYSHLIERNSGS